MNMARARRRLSRKTELNSSDPTRWLEDLSDSCSTPYVIYHGRSDDESDSCPACKTSTADDVDGGTKENWIGCDACKTWFHWRCAGNGENMDVINKWCVNGFTACEVL